MTLALLVARAKRGEPGRLHPGAVRALRWCAPLLRLLYRPTLDGLAHLPADGPFLLVANHSGAIAVAECMCFAMRYVEACGASKPLAGFAHPIGFYIWPASLALRHIGAVPSTHEAGEAALRQGVPLLIFPGGDHEALRPIWRANEVDFGGRVGFLKLARKMRVPIVPMGIQGSHYTAPVLWRSDYVLARLLILPRLLGLKRYPVTLLALLGVVAIWALVPWAWPFRVLAVWVWLMLPVPTMLPWIPWKVRMRVGAPLPPEALFPDDSEATLKAALRRVEGDIHTLVRHSQKR